MNASLAAEWGTALGGDDANKAVRADHRAVTRWLRNDQPPEAITRLCFSR
jgi:hypothetical protein